MLLSSFLMIIDQILRIIGFPLEDLVRLRRPFLHLLLKPRWRQPTHKFICGQVRLSLLRLLSCHQFNLFRQDSLENSAVLLGWRLLVPLAATWGILLPWHVNMFELSVQSMLQLIVVNTFLLAINFFLLFVMRLLRFLNLAFELLYRLHWWYRAPLLIVEKATCFLLLLLFVLLELFEVLFYFVLGVLRCGLRWQIEKSLFWVELEDGGELLLQKGGQVGTGTRHLLGGGAGTARGWLFEHLNSFDHFYHFFNPDYFFICLLWGLFFCLVSLHSCTSV